MERISVLTLKTMNKLLTQKVISNRIISYKFESIGAKDSFPWATMLVGLGIWLAVLFLINKAW